MMKRLTSFLVTLLATTALWAQTFQSGDLYYNILSESTVEVTYEKNTSANYANLTSVTIPATVTNESNTYTVSSIGEGAFMTCQKLTDVVIPESVTSIGERAFSSCNRLTVVRLPERLTSISDYVFTNCPALTSIDIPASVTSIGRGAFTNCSHLTSIVIPECVTSIGDNAFQGCDGLISITIPESVISIGRGAFMNCSHLTSVTLPNNLTRIETSMFAQCSSLASIVIPKTVISIDDRAFWMNMSLASIYVDAQTPPECGSDCFLSVPTDIPVYVPCGTKEAYQSSTGWSAFTNIIEPEPDYAATALSSNEKYGTAVIASHTCDNKLTVQATATNEHCLFTRWSDGSTLNPYTLVLTQDTVLTAEFEEVPSTEYTVSIVVDAEQHGTVQVTVRAVPDAGFRFIQWNDGNTDNPRTILVTENMTLRATFDIATNESDAQANEGTDDTRKVLRDGKMYIRRGDKTYTATGAEIK